MSMSKPLTVSRINDLTIGLFGCLPSSETLDHLVRYLGTWSGSDKLFMVLQNLIKILIPLLQLRARLQHRHGFSKVSTSASAPYLLKLDKVITDSRTFWRLWGLLPIFQWMISLEKNPQPTRTLLNIERLQGWSMLGFYPLDHIVYLCSQGVIPSSISLPFMNKTLKLNTSAMAMWSCRFWAAYVVLQILHLREDRKLLLQRQRDLRKAKVTPTAVEKQEIQNRWDAYWNEVVLNIGNLPLALHWSTEKGLIKNDVWVAVFGLIAAVASWRSGWKATALPASGIRHPDVADPPIAAVEAIAATA